MHDLISFKPTNHLLKAMTREAIKRLWPDLESVDLPLGTQLYRPYQAIEHVYFPEGSMASIVANTKLGESTEVGVVGREGAVGLDVLMGRDSSPHESMIQIANGGYRIGTAAMRKEFRRGGHVHDAMLLFVYKLMSQISQTTLCNRLHSLSERLSRWLLLCHDRVYGDQLDLTQEFIGIMLGATRVSVTVAASELQTAGFIKYTRGHITILDRKGLEDSTCECYAAVKREYDRT